MSSGNQTLLVVACHYRDTDRVLGFVRALHALRRPRGWNLEVAIADNSGDGERLAARSDLMLFRPPSNLGYMGGCAFAFEAWTRRRKQLPAWTAVVNTDLTLAPDFFERLLALELAPNVAMIAPGIHTDDREQNPFMRRRMSRLRAYLYTWICSSGVLHGLMRVTSRFRRPPAQVPAAVDSRDREIYAGHGSAMLFRPEFFARGGTLGYRGFMYGEEIHFAEQMRRLGLRTLWVPELRIEHHGHGVLAPADASRRRAWQRRSARIIWEDYFA